MVCGGCAGAFSTRSCPSTRRSRPAVRAAASASAALIDVPPTACGPFVGTRLRSAVCVRTVRCGRFLWFQRLGEDDRFIFTVLIVRIARQRPRTAVGETIRDPRLVLA